MSAGHRFEGRVPPGDPGRAMIDLRRARRGFIDAAGDVTPSAAQRSVLKHALGFLAAVDRSWDQLRQLCSGLPRAVVHGDFSEKNVWVSETGDGPVVHVFDWEMAAWGVAATDLFDVEVEQWAARMHEYGWVGQLPVGEVSPLATLVRTLHCLAWEAERLPGLGPERATKRIEPLVALLGSAVGELGWA
jgi:hypothetical protein